MISETVMHDHLRNRSGPNSTFAVSEKVFKNQLKIFPLKPNLLVLLFASGMGIFHPIRSPVVDETFTRDSVGSGF